MTVDLSSFKVAADEVSNSTKFDNLVQAIQDALNALPPSQLVGFPADATKFLRGDGAWAGAWGTYTPALTATTTNPTMGTGAIAEGRFLQIGKTVVCLIKIQYGTAGVATGTGTYRVSLPIAANSASGWVVGQGVILDDGTRFYSVNARTVGSTIVEMIEPGGASVTPTVPFAWAINDRILLQCMYEAA